MNNTGYTNYNGICNKCGKPFTYVGDIPEQGFTVGCEPYCTCGTEICAKCGQRYTPGPCDHESIGGPQ